MSYKTTSDTPCGFVRHVDCRDKDIANKLWENNSSCFEVPSMEKLPEEVLQSVTIFSSCLISEGTNINPNQAVTSLS